MSKNINKGADTPPGYFNVYEPGITDWLLGDTSPEISREYRKVIQTPTDGSEPVIWANRNEATAALGLTYHQICYALNNPQRVLDNSRWSYVYEECQ